MNLSLKNGHFTKTSVPTDFTGKFFQKFNEEMVQLFQRKNKKRIFPHSFYETSKTQKTEPDEDIIKKIQTNISNEHKNLK